jgi:hypothetical protein
MDSQELADLAGCGRQGGDGDDVFIYLHGHGSDSIDGGANWPDTIQFDQSAGSMQFGVDWTINLTSGSIVT